MSIIWTEVVGVLGVIWQFTNDIMNINLFRNTPWTITGWNLYYGFVLANLGVSALHNLIDFQSDPSGFIKRKREEGKW